MFEMDLNTTMNKLKTLLNSALLILLSTLLVIIYIVCERALVIVEDFFHIGEIPSFALHCIRVLFLIHILSEVIEFTFDINLKNKVSEFWKNRRK
jgi:hypothetical protein